MKQPNAKQAWKRGQSALQPRRLEFVDSTGPEIILPDYPRIEPGVYPAYCKWAKTYRDPGFRRWTCLLRFDVLAENLLDVYARLPMWLNLGSEEKPKAGRRSNYFKEYVRAGGTARADRRSSRIFLNRAAHVEVADVKSVPAYSIVRKILSWDTGQTSGSTSQQGHTVKEGIPNLPLK